MRRSVIVSLILCLGLLLSCGERKSTSAGADAESNSMYYWKTEFKLSPWEMSFLKVNDVRRIYLRFFDVDYGVDYDGINKPIPIGSVTFKDTVPPGIDVVPVVFLTKEALRHAYKDGAYDTELDLARLIYERVKAMAKGNRVRTFSEIQLDFDWAQSDRTAFFDFCRQMKSCMKDDRRTLSCTLRLHQLRGEMPPVDRATLMLYNTGSLYDTQTRNSILDISDVKPYLKGKIDCRLPLSVAYPTYSWGILTRGGKLVRILHKSDFSDAKLYKHVGENKYSVLRDHELEGLLLVKGDVIRLERSEIETILEVKRLVLAHLAQKPQSSVIYHLDSANLQKYSRDDIRNIFND